MERHGSTAGLDGRARVAERETLLGGKEGRRPSVERKESWQEPTRKVGLSPPRPARQASPTRVAQLAAVLFYCSSSIFIIFANKIVLTHYGFPSYALLAASQFFCTVTVLGLLTMVGATQVRFLGLDGLVTVAPVTLLFGLNVVAGLGGTQKISLPMFTVLRRFGILMTMLLEQHMGGPRATTLVWLAVVMMIAGAVTATMNDLSFDLTGYAMIMMANLLTAGYGVAVKLTLAKINTTTLLFYNSCFSLIVMASLLSLTPAGMEEVQGALDFESWGQPRFLIAFTLASVMGLVLNYATFLCVKVNSALTTAISGALKNVLTAYVGMTSLGGGYVFTWANFMGLNLSTAGGIVYSIAKYKEGRKAPESRGERDGRITT